MAASPIKGTSLLSPVWDFAIFVKKSIFRIFKPPQHFYPTCKNGLGGLVGRLWTSTVDWCGSLSACRSRLGSRSQKPPKIPIFQLWGPAPSPLLGANPRTPRRFHLRTTLKVRAKFGEDRPVNNGAHMGETSSCTAHRISLWSAYRFFYASYAGLAGSARPARTRVERSWQREPYTKHFLSLGPTSHGADIRTYNRADVCTHIVCTRQIRPGGGGA